MIVPYHWLVKESCVVNRLFFCSSHVQSPTQQTSQMSAVGGATLKEMWKVLKNHTGIHTDLANNVYRKQKHDHSAGKSTHCLLLRLLPKTKSSCAVPPSLVSCDMLALWWILVRWTIHFLRCFYGVLKSVCAGSRYGPQQRQQTSQTPAEENAALKRKGRHNAFSI